MTAPWWATWTPELPTLALTAGLVALYLRGAGRRPRPGTERRRTTAFLVGVGVVVVAETGPVGAWSDQLFWVHMVQHLLFVVVAAPLLAMGAPGATARLALPPTSRHTVARLARRWRRWRRTVAVPPLVVATVAHVLAVWLWHVPVAYDAAVADPALHLLEHLTFLGTGVWFWSEVWATARRHRRSQAVATLCLAAMIVQGGLLGALLTFAGRPLYGTYDGAVGLGPLADQQLGGALMWIPPGFVYGAVAIRRFVAWLQAVEHAARGRDIRRPGGQADRPDRRSPQATPDRCRATTSASSGSCWSSTSRAARS